MKQKFFVFHTMIKGSGKPDYVVKCAKILADRSKKVLILDGLMYEYGLVPQLIYEIFGSQPVIEDDKNLYDLIRNYENSCKRVNIFKRLFSRKSIYVQKLHETMPDITTFISKMANYPNLSFLPGNNGRVVKVRERIDFHKLFDCYKGYNFFDYLRSALSSEYDFILINAPAGHQEISGICCGQLADVLISVDVDNPVAANNPSFRACKRLAETVNRKRENQLNIIAIKGHSPEEVVEKMLQAAVD